MSGAEVQHLELENGLRLLCKVNPASPTVSIKMSIAAGAAEDPRGKEGLSDFARALLSRGTRSHNPARIAERIDSLGLELGFAAGRHTITASARVLGENLKHTLSLLSEVLDEPEPPEDEVERMRQRILTAVRRQQDDPGFVATEKLGRLIYGRSHPYGWTSEEITKAVRKISRDEILEFYTGKLAAGAAIAVLVGGFDVGTVESLASSTLGCWRGGGSFALRAPNDVKLPPEPKCKRIKMPEKTQSDIALGFRGIKRLDPSYHPFLVGNTVLGRLSLGGRIGQRIRDREGLAYYSFTSFEAGVGAGPFVFRAGVNPAHVDRAVQAALEEMRKAREKGITAEELEDAVVFLAGGMARQVETNGGMAATLLTQEIFGLGDDYYLHFETFLRELTLEAVNETLAAHLHADNYCLAVAGPY